MKIKKKKNKIIYIIITIMVISVIFIIQTNALDYIELGYDNIVSFKVYQQSSPDSGFNYVEVPLTKIDNNYFETSNSIIYTFKFQMLEFEFYNNPTEVQNIKFDITVQTDQVNSLTITSSNRPRIYLYYYDQNNILQTDVRWIEYQKIDDYTIRYYDEINFDNIKNFKKLMLYMNTTTLSSKLYYQINEFVVNSKTYIVINEINNVGNSIESALEEQSELEESYLADESDVKNAIEEQSEALETYIDRIENPLQHGDYPFFLSGLWENQYITIWLTIVCFFILSSLIIYGRF